MVNDLLYFVCWKILAVIFRNAMCPKYFQVCWISNPCRYERGCFSQEKLHNSLIFSRQAAFSPCEKSNFAFMSSVLLPNLRSFLSCSKSLPLSQHDSAPEMKSPHPSWLALFVRIQLLLWCSQKNSRKRGSIFSQWCGFSLLEIERKCVLNRSAHCAISRGERPKFDTKIDVLCVRTS